MGGRYGSVQHNALGGVLDQKVTSPAPTVDLITRDIVKKRVFKGAKREKKGMNCVLVPDAVNLFPGAKRIATIDCDGGGGGGGGLDMS